MVMAEQKVLGNLRFAVWILHVMQMIGLDNMHTTLEPLLHHDMNPCVIAYLGYRV